MKTIDELEANIALIDIGLTWRINTAYMSNTYHDYLELYNYIDGIRTGIIAMAPIKHMKILANALDDIGSMVYRQYKQTRYS